MVEFVVYAALISGEEAYILLSAHKDIVMSLVDLLIQERYLEDKKEIYDNFKEIKNPTMGEEEYNYFIDRYNNLNIEFGLLKRKSPDYH